MSFEINIEAQTALNRLESMPGMQQIKQQVEQLIQLARVAKRREEFHLKTSQQSLHMIFTGNPGTGKTTAARLIGEAFAAIGLLKSRDDVPFVEVHHSDVIHPHVGQAEKNMAAKFKEARGGVLFIDEAYAFVGGESNHRTGEKIIATIVQLMEDMRDEVLVIAAGYSNKMGEFLSSNPGLSSRFPSTIDFPDYEVSDLLLVAKHMIEDLEYSASADYLDALASVLWIEKHRPGFGNARTVRNHVERSIRKQADRVLRLTAIKRKDLMELIAADIVHSVSGTKRAEREVLSQIITEAQQRMNELNRRALLYGEF
jgi:stage V sporulation protein K